MKLQIYILLLFFIISVDPELVQLHFPHTTSGFLLYNSTAADTKEIVYKNPPDSSFQFSLNFGNKIVGKIPISKLNYSVNFYIDRPHYDSFTNSDEKLNLHGICKFDYTNNFEFGFVKNPLKCLVTIHEPLNKRLLGRNTCNLELSHVSGVCYALIELNSAKERKVIVDVKVMQMSKDFNLYRDKVLVNKISELTLSQEYLPVKYYDMNVIGKLLKFEYVLPIDSGKSDELTVVTIQSNGEENVVHVTFLCTLGEYLMINDIRFIGTKYTGEFRKNGKTRDVNITVSLSNEIQDPMFSSNEEPIVKLALRFGKIYVKNKSKYQRTISCQVDSSSLKFWKTDYKITEKFPKIPLVIPVNNAHFIAVPIMQKQIYYSIMDKVEPPIKISQSNLSVLSVFSKKDGAIINVTKKCTCEVLDPVNLVCPVSNDQTTAIRKSNKRNTQLHSVLIRNTQNYEFILSMMGWQRSLNLPVEIWDVKDWKLELVDANNLRVIDENWTMPISKNGRLSRDGLCSLVIQKTRCHLIGRLTSINNNDMTKMYYGESKENKHPWIDFTNFVNSNNLILSSPKLLNVDFRSNYLLLSLKHQEISKVNPGTYIDIKVTDKEMKRQKSSTKHYKAQSLLAIERVMIDKNPKKAIGMNDMVVRCVRKPNLTISSQKSYRKVRIENLYNSTNCILDIQIILKNGRRIDLRDYLPDSGAYLVLEYPNGNGRETIKDLDSFIYKSKTKSDEGKFTLRLMTHPLCKSIELLSKKVNLIVEKPKFQPPSSSNRVDIPTKSLIKHKTKRKGYQEVTDLPTTVAVNTEIPTHIKISTQNVYLAIKISIGFFILVIVIIIIKCAVKCYRRHSHNLRGHQACTNIHSHPPNYMPAQTKQSEKDMISHQPPQYPGMPFDMASPPPDIVATNNSLSRDNNADKLLNHSTYMDNHPPLLPPPGPPVYNIASDLSPELFWSSSLAPLKRTDDEPTTTATTATPSSSHIQHALNISSPITTTNWVHTPGNMRNHCGGIKSPYSLSSDGCPSNNYDDNNNNSSSHTNTPNNNIDKSSGLGSLPSTENSNRRNIPLTNTSLSDDNSNHSKLDVLCHHINSHNMTHTTSFTR